MTNPDSEPGPLTHLELEQIAANQQRYRDHVAKRLRRSHAIPDTDDPDSPLDTAAWAALLVQIATIDGLDGLAWLPQTRDDVVRELENQGEYEHALALCAVDDQLLTQILDEMRRQLLGDSN